MPGLPSASTPLATTSPEGKTAGPSSVGAVAHEPTNSPTTSRDTVNSQALLHARLVQKRMKASRKGKEKAVLQDQFILSGSQDMTIISEAIALLDGPLEESLLGRRATGTGPVAAGLFQYPDCSNVGNDVLTCFPTASTVLVQDVWSKVIWNFNYPEFIAGADEVDLYLFHADSDLLAESYKSLPNPEGQLAVEPSDSWWSGVEAADNIAVNQTLQWSFYWIIAPAGTELDGTQDHQATFIANQTAVPSTIAALSVSSSISQSSVSASSVRASSLSERSASMSSRAFVSSYSASANAASALSQSSISVESASGRTPTGSLQNSSGSSGGLPVYADALLGLLGGLLGISLLVLAYLFLRHLSRRRQEAQADYSFGSRNQLMSEAVDGGVGGLGVTGAASGAGLLGRNKSTPTTTPIKTGGDTQGYQEVASPVASSTAGHGPVTHAASPITPLSPPSAISSTAAAAAFRQGLREPESNVPSESSSPGDSGSKGTPPSDAAQKGQAEEVMRRELAAEGMGVKQVAGIQRAMTIKD